MKKKSECILFDGAWLAVHEMIYENKDGRALPWEVVRRKKNQAGVVIVAQLMPSRRFVLIKQFRPAVNGYVIGFPAGLAYGDPAHALVELKEETGYTGKIIEVSPFLKTGSSAMDDSAQLVYVHVDETTAENQHPQQQLEAGEDIEVFCLAKKEVKDFLLAEHTRGTFISANVWYVFVLAEMLKELNPF